MELFKVIAKETGSLQPGYGATFWTDRVLYCGTDRQQARIAYHRSTSEDYDSGYGNRCRKTKVLTIADANTDDFNDDSVEPAEL